MAVNTKYLEEEHAIEFVVDGNTISTSSHESILEAAKRNGVEIPRLCYKQGFRTDGNCRACLVEIEGERILQPSCVRTPIKGMVVHTNNKRALHSQKMVLELLQSDITTKEYTLNSELDQWSQKLHIGLPRFKCRKHPQNDVSHPAIAVNLDACIQCTRCLRACREEQNNDVIGYAMRGSHSKIVFDFDDPMGDSTCVACGECVQACPTGALMPATVVDAQGKGDTRVDKKVESVCPYCGVGCQISYNVKDNKLKFVEGREGPANQNRLCVKGRFGFDYISHPERILKPLMRKKGSTKNNIMRCSNRNLHRT